VKRTFCPPKECYDPKLNADQRYGQPLPPFVELLEQGKICALNFPVALNPGLAKAIGVMMKLDFQRALLNRIPKIEASPKQHFRQVFFICDEYQHFATAAENEPNGDDKFFALSTPIEVYFHCRHSKHQLPCARHCREKRGAPCSKPSAPRSFLALSDEFSAKIASELCGKEDQWKVNYNISESGHDARVSLWTGKALAHKANVTTSKSYNTSNVLRFDFKTFTELKNAQSVALVYDGLNPMPPTFMYLKPYYNDVKQVLFSATRRWRALMDGFKLILPFLRPIENLILDSEINEIMVNGSDRIFVERQGHIYRCPRWPSVKSLCKRRSAISHAGSATISRKKTRSSIHVFPMAAEWRLCYRRVA
jgi:hypothetical protein